MPQWWIDEPNVFGSRNPTDAELEKLFQEGFRTIISLLDETEQRPHHDVKKAEAMGFRRYSIPVGDFKAPTQAQFQEFFEIMSQAQGKVLIHCMGGSDRTGTMGAAYWINKRLPAHEAITKMKQSNPGAVEEPVQEDSLYELQASIIEK